MEGKILSTIILIAIFWASFFMVKHWLFYFLDEASKVAYSVCVSLIISTILAVVFLLKEKEYGASLITGSVLLAILIITLCVPGRPDPSHQATVKVDSRVDPRKSGLKP